ncbi:MAG: beta-ketoacyl synthase N-terminal-like domain-containing protein [Sutterellaceae bacterium]|nr:beta-ketoacyl synthase N-terminal-like domain-containing protein [Sutterellaceae bacterium]
MTEKEGIFLHCPTCVSALGLGLEKTAQALLSQDFVALDCYKNVLGEKSVPYGIVKEVSDANSPADYILTRTNRLIRLCLDTTPEIGNYLRHFDSARVAVVLGASTSGMREIELGIETFHKKGELPQDFTADALNLSDPAAFTADALGVRGPVFTVSNACASGAMALETAAEMIRAGIVDAVVTGGIDGFSKFTSHGFSSLGAMSNEQCSPFAENRHGINLGEGGALLVLSKEPSPVELAGWASTCDAHHASAPEPEGTQASAAMQRALGKAQLSSQDIDFVSAHGTATALNDAMESKAIARVFGSNTPVASLKGLTGHTLAGAGALQAAFAWIVLTMNPEGKLPVNGMTGNRDSTLSDIDLVMQPRKLNRPLKAVMGNAFAFGGSNAVLIFKSVEI